MIEGINPGQLDRRITIQSRTTAPNEFNEPVETWATLADVWAKVDYPVTGSDEKTDGVNVTTTRVVFTVRHLSGVGFTDRIQYDSEVYDIERISELGRKSYLELTAERRK